MAVSIALERTISWFAIYMSAPKNEMTNNNVQENGSPCDTNLYYVINPVFWDCFDVLKKTSCVVQENARMDEA